VHLGPEGREHFNDYVEAVHWAQDYAMQNRQSMLDLVLGALHRHLPPFRVTSEVVNCHHNYVAQEHHYRANVWVTRKGAIRARAGDLGIVPGRRISRIAATQQFTEADLIRQTAGVICRKDRGVIDEIPRAYKDIDVVMENQSDLTEIVHTLKQVVCMKG
jgi:tRNA-splicing ligase RtcB (3'-phosphate/5'-hydroxy nucleic acid ligase)